MLLKLQKIKTGFLNKRIMYHASFCLTNFFIWLTFNRWISTLRMLIQRLNGYFCITRHFLWRTSLFCSNVASCIWVDSTWLTRIFQTHTPAKVTLTSVDAELFLRARLSFFFLAVQRWQGLKRYLTSSFIRFLSFIWGSPGDRWAFSRWFEAPVVRRSTLTTHWSWMDRTVRSQIALPKSLSNA